MKTEVTPKDANQVELAVTVENDELRAGVDRALATMGRSLRLPGFRPGKVPAKVLLGQFGFGAALQQAVQDSLGDWYSQAVDEAGVTPVAPPEVDLGSLPESEDGELTFTATVTVRPEATLPDLATIEVARAAAEVPDDQLDRQIQRMRETFATLAPVPDGRAAQLGDHVVVDYDGTVDGEAFPGGAGRDLTVELGSGKLIPGFEDHVVGHVAGDTFTFEITFPADYGATELAGKDAEFSLTVKDVKEMQLPDVDDDLAAEAGFDTLDELRDDLRTRLAAAAARAADEHFRRDVLNALADAADVDVPEAMVDAQVDSDFHRLTHQLEERGVTFAAYAQATGQDEARFKAEMRDPARTTLRQELAMLAVAERAGLEVTDDELAAQIDAEFEGQKNAKQLKKRVRRSGVDEQVRRQMLLARAAEHAAGAVTTTELDAAASREKLFPAPAGAGAGETSAASAPAASAAP